MLQRYGTQPLNGSLRELSTYLKKAIHILKQQGLECIPQDTTFSLKHKLGAVVTQQPPAEALVKEGRHIYVTINKSEYPTITVDNKILKNMDEDSRRQPSDISLAFIGCEDLEQFKQAQQPHLAQTPSHKKGDKT